MADRKNGVKTMKTKDRMHSGARTRTIRPAMTPENDALIERKHDDILEVKFQAEQALTELQSLGLPQIVIDEIEDKFLDIAQRIEDLAERIDYGYTREVRVGRGRK